MFEDPAWLAWVGVALVLGAVEMATVDFTFLMLAGGALGGGAAAALGAPLPIQALVAAVTACLLLVGVRPWAKRRFSPHGPRHVMGTAAHVGRTAYVVQTVTRTTGQIRLGGEIWSARTTGDAIGEGEPVRVTAIDGATAVVARDHDALT